jgi:hypothetical protein
VQNEFQQQVQYFHVVDYGARASAPRIAR